MQSKGGMAWKERWLLTVRNPGVGFDDGRDVKDWKKKKRRRRKAERRRRKNFEEISPAGLSLFHAFAMEKEKEEDEDFSQ